MYFGNTASQRRDYISSVLQFDKPIIDIGCGDGYYAIPYSQKLSDLPYYAIDIDNECLNKIKKKMLRDNITNIVPFNNYTELDTIGRSKVYDVIISEVVEHMDPYESQEIIKFILDKINFNKIIITTPNFEFNKYYNLTGFRHDDHKWEYTREQFQKYIEKIIMGYQINVQYIGIGDIVDGILTTQGAIITKS